METTVKVKFRPSTVTDRPGSIIYQVTHRRVVRQITSGYKIFPEEWDEKKSQITPVFDKRTETVHAIRQGIRNDLERLSVIVERLNHRKGGFTTDDVVKSFYAPANGQSFFRFMEGVIGQLERLNKERTVETYTTAFNSLMRFRKNEDLLLDEVTSDLMMEYEAWLKSTGIKMNTVSFYNRILSAVYNRAVEKELTVQRYPFKHVYTKIDKTVKRAISLKEIRKIKELDLTLEFSLDFARNLFMFSFYTRGMSFVDMAYLQKKDLKNGILSYCRRKTGQQLFIKWEKPMQEIIDKYDTTGTPYLLPIIKTADNERKQYRNALRLANNRLKKISELAGLQIDLTMYVARHSWASIAKSQNIPLSVISEGMGHDSETTTQIYLASLDNSTIDEANELILRKL